MDARVDSVVRDIFCRMAASEVLGRESPDHKVWSWVVGKAPAAQVLIPAQKQSAALYNNSWALIYGSGPSGTKPDTSALRIRVKQYDVATSLCRLAAQDVWDKDVWDQGDFNQAMRLADFSRQYPVLVTGRPGPKKMLDALSYLHKHSETQRLSLLRTPEAELVPLGMLWLWRALRLPDEWAVRDWAKFHGVPGWALR